MKKKMVSMLLAIAMTASLAVGCSSSSSSSSNTTTEADTTQADTTQVTEASTEATQTTEAAVQSGTVTFSIDMTQYEKGKTVRVWIPVAQTNEYQTIEDVTFDTSDENATINEDSNGNKMLYVEWDADAEPESRTATVSFHVTRTEILSQELVEEGTVGSDLDEYLQASSTIPVDGTVKELADEITKDETTYLGKARAIYDWIIANMNRDESVVGCGQGDVCALIESKAGKCTDINSVFVGLCRSVGVPAREMFGVRINDTDITNNEHCWAEFYLPGTGWVAADPADVLKAVLKNSWDKDSEETKEIQEYYWGNCDEKRVELSRGRDITLSPAQSGEALNNFGYPYGEVDGEALDYYTPDTFKYTISFEQDN
jgi:transglutaminase-like putative cysteine protease